MEQPQLKLTLEGKKYHSLDELPPQYKKIITPEFLEQVKKKYPQDYEQMIMLYAKQHEGPLSFIKFLIYGVSQLSSFAESQAMRITMEVLHLPTLNVLISLLSGLLAGEVGYRLAVRNFEKQKIRSGSPALMESMDFVKQLYLTQLTAGYALLINGIIYITVLLIRFAAHQF